MSGLMPVTPRPSVCNITSVDPTMVSTAWSQRRQTNLLDAQRWAIELEWPLMQRATAAPLFAFAAAQRGRSGIFSFKPPIVKDAQGTGNGSPVCRNRSNHMLYSDDYSQTIWTKDSVAQGTPAYVASPDGTDMQEWHRTDPTLTRWMRQEVGTFVSLQVLSAYIKAGTAATSRLNLYDATGLASHSVDIVWTAGVPSLTNLVAIDASGVYAVGGGVYRVWIAIDAEARGIVGSLRRVYLYPSVGADLYGCYWWRVQLEEGYAVPGYRLQTTSAAIALEAQGGSTLYTGGWTASQATALLAGDFLSIAGGVKVYMATANAAADANGVAAISVCPDLLVAPTAGAALTIDDVAFTAAFDSDLQEFACSKPHFFGYRARLIEVV